MITYVEQKHSFVHNFCGIYHLIESSEFFLLPFSANGSFELHLADLHLPLDQFELAHSIERDTQINKQIKTEKRIRQTIFPA